MGGEFDGSRYVVTDIAKLLRYATAVRKRCSVPDCNSHMLDQGEPIRLVPHGLRSTRTSPLCAECDSAAEKRCIQCSRWYASLSTARLHLCSLACERDHRNARRRAAPPFASCAGCTREFVPTRSDALYCSPACRQRAHRRRHPLRGS